jgi:hypothetical protein
VSDKPITAEDLGVALTGVAVALMGALKPKLPNRVLEELANELRDLAERAPGTPASDALAAAAKYLMASEPND